MKQYQHLNKEERFYIWNSLRNGASQVDVARDLGRSPSTICREIRRNTYPQCKMYTYHWALDRLKWRKYFQARTKHRKVTPTIGIQIETLVQQRLSPEQVSGYLKRHHSISLSHETIYRYIYSDSARHKRLKPYLRQGQ